MQIFIQPQILTFKKFVACSLQKSQGLQAIYFEFQAHGIDIMEWAKALKSFMGYWRHKLILSLKCDENFANVVKLEFVDMILRCEWMNEPSFIIAWWRDG